jgi:hypothetical protein
MENLYRSTFILPHLFGVWFTDVNECTNSPCIEGTCVNQLGFHLCLCEPGFTLERNNCIGNIIIDIIVSCYQFDIFQISPPIEWKWLPDFDECECHLCQLATRLEVLRCGCPEGGTSLARFKSLVNICSGNCSVIIISSYVDFPTSFSFFRDNRQMPGRGRMRRWWKRISTLVR